MVLAACVFSAFSVASALASPEWLVDKNLVTEELPSVTTGELTFEDMKAVGGPVKAVCPVSFLGTVGIGFLGLIEVVENSKEESDMICTLLIKGLCTGETALLEALHLPWLTELAYTIEGDGIMVRDTIKDSGDGEPAYDAVCKTIIGEETDECHGETSYLVEELAMSTVVSGEFDAASKGVTCSMGGAEQGLVSSIGPLLISVPGGHALEIS
jgi:hypothetical protein